MEAPNYTLRSIARGVVRRIRCHTRSALVGGRRTSASILGAFRGNGVQAYWHAKEVNFGDMITPLLLARYGFTPIHAEPKHARLVSTGSLLEAVPETYSGCVLGTGLMKDGRRSFPNAQILGVRGALTRDLIGADPNVVLGDPGLLAAELMPRREEKKYVLGIVPHYVDKRDPRVHCIKRRYPNEVLVVDVVRHPLRVFADIDRCEFILSSSLHGLVTADSLGIPCSWILLSDRVYGAGFKFADYNSALGSVHDPLALTGEEMLSELTRTTRKPPDTVGKVKSGLDRAFASLADVLGHAGD